MRVIRGIALAALTSGAAIAQDLNVQDGNDLYRTYCWQCHGFEATGDGPTAEMLAIRTPDLTKLAARNDGVFPTELVAQQVDGRSPVLAHGGEMPIFGPALDSDKQIALSLPSGQPMMTGVPLASLIAFLQTIQVE